MMRKKKRKDCWLILGLSLWLIAACDRAGTGTQHNATIVDSIASSLDSISPAPKDLLISTPITVAKNKSAEDHPTDIEAVTGKSDSMNRAYAASNNTKKIKALLERPIDLVAFKKACRGNNGGFRKQPYFFEPKKEGFYYKYFLFMQCGCSTDFNDLVVVVYKFGKKIQTYSNTNEKLVAIAGACQSKELNECNLVGKAWSSICAIYGNNYLTIGAKRIYAHKGNLLILDLNEQEQIVYFKYLKTNLKEIKTVDDIPPKALEKFF